MSAEVVYRVDSKYRLTAVNAEWDLFAVANGAAGLRAPGILSRPLWDFVTDGPTRHFYHVILEQARAGRRLRFPFRCDSPDLRRFLEMDASGAGEGSVEFRVRTVKTEPREPVALMDPSRERTGPALRMCGWCKKVVVDEAYVEVEEAIARLDLFGGAALPPITHGICPAREARMFETLGVKDHGLPP